jgi:hypothetical protein
MCDRAVGIATTSVAARLAPNAANDAVFADSDVSNALDLCAKSEGWHCRVWFRGEAGCWAVG